METKELILNARLSAGPELQAPRHRNDNNTSSADTGHDNTGHDMASIPDDDPTVQANVHQLSMLLQRWWSWENGERENGEKDLVSN